MLHEPKINTIEEVTLAATMTEQSEGGDEPEAATSCDVLHQFDGDEACQSHCTLDFGHAGDHLCGNGHAF